MESKFRAMPDWDRAREWIVVEFLSNEHTCTTVGIEGHYVIVDDGMTEERAQDLAVELNARVESVSEFTRINDVPADPLRGVSDSGCGPQGDGGEPVVPAGPLALVTRCEDCGKTWIASAAEGLNCCDNCYGALVVDDPRAPAFCEGCGGALPDCNCGPDICGICCCEIEGGTQWFKDVEDSCIESGQTGILHTIGLCEDCAADDPIAYKGEPRF